MTLVPQRPERYLRAPRFQREDGRVGLYVIAWEAVAERVLRFEVGDDAEILGEAYVTPPQAHIAGYAAEAPEPSTDAEWELVAASSRSRVRVEQGEGVSTVHLTRDGREILVLRAPAMIASPAVAEAAGGTWIAFHHDLREDERTRDVAKWIALRFVDDAGRVFEPGGAMADRDRDREGVEQSFEFPALVVGEDGAVAVFGRGSHNFWRQDLDGSGFGPRVPLSDGEWGSRGRRVSAIATARGVLVARRDRQGIIVDVGPAPAGGRPPLVEAEVELGGASPRPTWDRSRDPARARGFHTFFGDIQQHSAHSDGVGSAEEAYLRARDRYGDDFVALTDHESFLGKRTGPGEWEYLKDVADRFEQQGRFATLIAYEWTGRMYPGPGHKCVYFPERDRPIVSRDDVPVGADVVRRIAELGGISSPHHIGWTGCDEEGHDPVGQPVWEICSCHGCYEHADHPLGQRGELRDQLVDVMLARGHRFGFTAASDSHGLLYHHGECRKRDPYRTGLTAVLAPSLDRRAVFDAIRARRCYATSGAKIRLDFTGNGESMGGEIATSGAPVRFFAHAIGEDELDRIELVGPSGVLARAEVCGDEGTIEADLRAPYVYARVVQRDGEMAWSSPIFAD
jgi:hypothetical protein